MTRNSALLSTIALLAANTLLFPAAAATLTAKSLNVDDVAAAISAAQPGDTVALPRGGAAWTRGILVNKPITISGAGPGLTVITNLQTKSNMAEGVVFDVRASKTGITRITGIEFNGARASGILYISGDLWAPVRVDHCRFVDVKYRAAAFSSLLSGLVDNCEFVDCGKTVDVYGGQHSNLSWAEPLTLGTTNTVVVEDCLFRYESWYPSSTAATSSRGLGSRSVIRFCEWKNNLNIGFFPIIDAHGNQLPVQDNVGNHRGNRQFEMYGNKFQTATFKGKGYRLTDLRGGTSIIFSNTFTGTGMQTVFRMREEDGPSAYGYRSAFPGNDSHMVYAWDNRSNGTLIQTADFAYPEDPEFIRPGVNLFWQEMPGYKPLQYPHPMRREATAPEAPASLRLADAR
jgi:hypothetical protein